MILEMKLRGVDSFKLMFFRFAEIIDGLLAESARVEFFPIDGGFSDWRRLGIKFALHRPKVAVSRLADDINAQIDGTEFVAEGKFIPKPDVGEFSAINRTSQQEIFHEPFKFRTFVAFGKIFFAIID